MVRTTVTQASQGVTNLTKRQVAKWLLISLPPGVVVWFVAIAILGAYQPDTSPPGVFFGILIFFLTIYLPFALVIGLTLHIWLNHQARRMFRTTQRYAELHGWLPVSRTQWRNRKRNQIQLTVAKAFAYDTFILTIQANDETFTVDEFESSTWALQFGDWVWEQILMTDDPVISPTLLHEKRAEWQTTALALR